MGKAVPAYLNEENVIKRGNERLLCNHRTRRKAQTRDEYSVTSAQRRTKYSRNNLARHLNLSAPTLCVAARDSAELRKRKIRCEYVVGIHGLARERTGPLVSILCLSQAVRA